MKYERLSISELRLNNDIRAKSYYVNGISICDLYNRLAELEDKIENGTLRERPEEVRLIFTRDEKDPFMLITKEEYSNYLTLKNDYAHAKEKNKKLQADNERLYNNLAKFKKSVQTETLEKIKLIPIECGEECGHYYLDISVTGKELLQRVYFTSSFIDGKIRKETAKEILQLILNESRIDIILNKSGFDILGDYYKLPTRTLNKIKRQFGIEVEECQ